MLARLRGTLESITANTAVIATDAGRAYEVLLPAVDADGAAARLGQTVTLHTMQYLEAQAQGSSYIPRLIGFQSIDDRRFFELFTTVKGMGNKRALRALRTPFPRIASAIAARDAKFLQTLPEIGKRLAETIIVDLHEKVDAFLTTAHASGAPGAEIESKGLASGALSDAARQAVDALVHLGDSRADAEELVRRALAQHAAPDDAGAPPQPTPDEILTAAFALRS
jgi:Holliday junction DNA helicase RuvA